MMIFWQKNCIFTQEMNLGLIQQIVQKIFKAEISRIGLDSNTFFTVCILFIFSKSIRNVIGTLGHFLKTN